MGYAQGLLWFDGKGKLEVRLERAIAHYEGKFQHRPDMALVNPNDYAQGGEPERVSGIEVIPSANMSKSHCLIGVASAAQAKLL